MKDSSKKRVIVVAGVLGLGAAAFVFSQGSPHEQDAAAHPKSSFFHRITAKISGHEKPAVQDSADVVSTEQKPVQSRPAGSYSAVATGKASPQTDAVRTKALSAPSRKVSTDRARQSGKADGAAASLGVTGGSVWSKQNQAKDKARRLALQSGGANSSVASTDVADGSVWLQQNPASVTQIEPTSSQEGTTQSTPTGNVSGENNQPEETAKPEAVIPALNVVQIARNWQDGVMQVSFAVFPDDDNATAVPNGVIVSQQIPDGWDVVDAVPQIESIDGNPRTAKWLLVGDAAQKNSIYSLSIRASEPASADWNQTLAWYTYRQPDGQCINVTVLPYTDSAIQPTP